MAEQADALRSGRSGLYAHVGSTPTFGTKARSLWTGLFCCAGNGVLAKLLDRPAAQPSSVSPLAPNRALSLPHATPRAIAFVILSSSMARRATQYGMTPKPVIARRPEADEAIPNCSVETASLSLAVTASMSSVAPAKDLCHTQLRFFTSFSVTGLFLGSSAKPSRTTQRGLLFFDLSQERRCGQRTGPRGVLAQVGARRRHRAARRDRCAQECTGDWRRV